MRAHRIGRSNNARRLRTRALWLGLLAGLFSIVAISGAGGSECFGQSTQPPDEVIPERPYPEQVNPAPPNAVFEIPATESSSDQANAPAPAPIKPANEDPSGGASVQAPAPEQQTKQESLDAITDPNKKQVANDTANLLKLANRLKAEVDKTSQDTLSVTVVREAGEIEKLAHKMRTK